MNAAERAARIAERTREMGCATGSDVVARLLSFLDAMLERNRSLNLTAIRDTDAAEVLHVLDALAVSLVGEQPERCLDIGSGNGFPGIAAAALWPETEVVLMERTGKKAAALTELVEAAGFWNARVQHVDAAQAPTLLPELRRHFDLVTARAVGAPELVTRLAAPMVARGGRLVLWMDAETEIDPKPTRGFALAARIPYVLPEPAARARVLAVYEVRRGPP